MAGLPEFGFPARHAGVGFGSLCERVFLDHGANTRHLREAKGVSRICFHINARTTFAVL